MRHGTGWGVCLGMVRVGLARKKRCTEKNCEHFVFGVCVESRDLLI